MFVILTAFQAVQRPNRQKPSLFSLSALGLLVLNLILFLTDSYGRLPLKISEIIVFPFWFLICLLGAIAAWKEIKNNQIFAALNGGLAAITFIVGLLLLLIGSM